MRIKSLPDRPFLDLTLLTFILALLFCVGLGDRPYSAPSESRYIEIGREMAESGDFVTPRLNYVKYFEKPPLFYWVQALSTKAFGYSPFAARLPTTGFAVLLCLITYLLTRMLYGRLAGWLGTLCLGTSLYLFALSRIVLLDVPVSVFLVSTLAAFLYAAHAPPSRKRSFVVYAMYAAAAGAVLTKGLIGAVLPGAVIFLWLCFTGRWAILKELRLASGTLLFLLLAAPWHILVAERNPEWAWFYFVHEHWLRYTTPEAGRSQPFWFFFAVLIAGWFPWFPFLWQAGKSGLESFWQKRREDGKPLFLVIWIAFILLFFSASHSKLIPYIVPIFPPLAALLGRYFADAWKNRPVRGFGIGVFGLVLLLAIMAALPGLLLSLLDKDNKVTIALSQAGDDLHTLTIGSMIAAGLLLIAFVQGRKRHAILAMLLAAAIELQLGNLVSTHYDKDSMQEFSNIVKEFHTPGDEVAMYQLYYQDMPLYTGARVTIVDWKGELEFGSAHEDDSAWMINSATFWQRWMKNDHQMFVTIRDDALSRVLGKQDTQQLHLFLLDQKGRNLFFVNRLPVHPERKKP